MSRKRKRKLLVAFEEGAIAKAPSSLYPPPTGELEGASALAPFREQTLTSLPASTSTNVATGERKDTAVVSNAVGSVGMTPWDFLDRWLPRYDWLWYAMPAVLVFTAAIFSGNLKTLKEFGLIALTVGFLEVVVALAKRT